MLWGDMIIMLWGDIIIIMLVIKNISIKFEKNVRPVKIKRISVGYKDILTTNKHKYHQLDLIHYHWH